MKTSHLKGHGSTTPAVHMLMSPWAYTWSQNAPADLQGITTYFCWFGWITINIMFGKYTPPDPASGAFQNSLTIALFPSSQLEAHSLPISPSYHPFSPLMESNSTSISVNGHAMAVIIHSTGRLKVQWAVTGLAAAISLPTLMRTVESNGKMKW